MMKPENPDTVIADLHRVREEIAAESENDLFAITAAARARMMQSGKEIRPLTTADTPAAIENQRRIRLRNPSKRGK
jgi:hypothetical protein